MSSFLPVTVSDSSPFGLAHVRRWGLRALALVSLAAIASAADTRVPGTTVPGGGRIVFETGVPPPVPVFFSVTAEHTLRVTPTELTGEAVLQVVVLQGRPETLVVGIEGEGEVVAVGGSALRDWSIRQRGTGSSASRWLVLRPVLPETGDGPRSLDFKVQFRRAGPPLPGLWRIPLVVAGEAAGFVARCRVAPDARVDVRLVALVGASALAREEKAGRDLLFALRRDARIEIEVTGRGASAREVELMETRVSGVLEAGGGSVHLRLRGVAQAKQPGARLRLLSGGAALSESAAGDGWQVDLVREGDAFAYDLVVLRPGAVPFDLTWVAAVRTEGDWQSVDFKLAAGTVVPLELTGWTEAVAFDPNSAVVPLRGTDAWRGFLPGDGSVQLRWRERRESVEPALAFATSERSEVRLGDGLWRQVTTLDLRVMQGRMSRLRVLLEGPGELVSVTGDASLTWTVRPGAGGERWLEVEWGRPVEETSPLVITSQAALGAFPALVEPLRLVPEGALRHSGLLRIGCRGAVRVDVTESAGLMQLAPAAFPGETVEDGVSAVWVFRFSSAERRLRLRADPVLPEVIVSQVTTYALGETERRIESAVELEIREAPLREVTLHVPAEYALVAVQGEDVADYALETEAKEGRRALRLVFSQPVDGRRLLRLRLERLQVAASGPWMLPVLRFPSAKSVRGQIGIKTTPGYRMSPGGVRELAELPLSLYSDKSDGLQLAFRVRSEDWTAVVNVEAVGQSVQADVFHLYSLREGVVAGSVLFNFFVIGAPASEWRIAVPSGAANIDVQGQGVRREWRREGDEVVVTLHEPALGAVSMLVTFELPMAAGGGVFQPGLVRPLGVQSERGYVQIVSPGQVRHDVRRAEGSLLRLEAMELPVEYRFLTEAPSLATFHYTARPFVVEVAYDGYTEAETVDQVVEYAELNSRVGRDGQVATEARFFVKTRGQKSLRVRLPEGTRLWEARTDGQSVSARREGADTLIPLSARLNPNEPVDVLLRYGQPATDSTRTLQLVAPSLVVPAVLVEWRVRSENGRQLVPRGGSAVASHPVVPETGWEWLGDHARGEVLVLLGLLLVGAVALRAGSSRWLPVSLLAGLVGLVLAANLTVQAWHERREMRPDLEFSLAAVPASQPVTLVLSHVPTWQAWISFSGLTGMGIGAILAWMSRSRARGTAARNGLLATSAVALGAGLLAQPLGAVFFFPWVSGGAFLGLCTPAAVRLAQSWRRRRSDSSAEGGGATTMTSALGAVVLLVAGLGHGPEVRAEKAAPPPTAATVSSDIERRPLHSLLQSWDIRQGRLQGEIEVTVRGGAGESFVLLRSPAVLTAFTGEGLRVTRLEVQGESLYLVVPERDGIWTGRARFELAVPDLAAGVPVLTGPAAVQRVTVRIPHAGWDVTSSAAVRTEALESPEAGDTRTNLVLAPGAGALISFRPRLRDPAQEVTSMVTEVTHLFVPGPGVVEGYARVVIKPVRGRVGDLSVAVPEGFAVSAIEGATIGRWRFDPTQQRLQIAVDPSQVEPFEFMISLQRAAPAFPYALDLSPVRVEAAQAGVSTLGLAFGSEAQPEGITATGLAAVALEDFAMTGFPVATEKTVAPVVQSAYRVIGDNARLTLRVAAVTPEIRVTSRQVISLGDDRLVLAADLDVTIARAGVFRLGLTVPAGLELESASSPVLSHWTETVDASGTRQITLHLREKTMGDHRFSLTLAGAAPRAQPAWVVPRIVVREAARQSGDLRLVPERGLRLRVGARQQVSPIDPRTLGPVQSGVLAFRLLQEAWSLTLAVEALEPWLTTQVLQEMTLRDGQSLVRGRVRLRVENAGVKQLRLRLLGLRDDQIASLRLSGPLVADSVRRSDDPEVWEVRLVRAVLGETELRFDYQGKPATETVAEWARPVAVVGARSVHQVVAVRTAGRLELQAPELSTGWQRMDWSAVPSALQDPAERTIPALCLRVTDPDQPLSLSVRRQDVAEALKVRVTQALLTTQLSPQGPWMTRAELSLQVQEKSTLRIQLPADARLFGVWVNGESVIAARDAADTLVPIAPVAEAERATSLMLLYASGSTNREPGLLQGPGLNAPVEQVVWRVITPRGYEVDASGDEFQLVGRQAAGAYGMDDYKRTLASRRTTESSQAKRLLEQAGQLLEGGQSNRAGALLSRVTKAPGLDAASNEDARVQLRTLRTQQAVVALTTRRQRLYLDQSGDVARNAALEQAATANPLMQGKSEMNLKQADHVLMGNTAEENAALRGMAGRLVDQQLAAEPTASALDVIAPVQGRVATFTRSLQVDGRTPLALRLDLEREGRGDWMFGLLVLGVVAAAVLIRVSVRAPAAKR
jgi:hypothetical protein